jgi:hypothetical protein
MKTFTAVSMVIALLAPISMAAGQSSSHSFTLNANGISGLSGEVTLTGGGDYDLPSRFLKAGGHFTCTQAVSGGPLAGCQIGEGIRWDSDSLLTSTPFRCNGSETPITIFTTDDTVVMHADFYRQGDGREESFRANMIVSSGDLDPNQQGTQNVWIQGVGCTEGMVTFH